MRRKWAEFKLGTWRRAERSDEDIICVETNVIPTKKKNVINFLCLKVGIAAMMEPEDGGEWRTFAEAPLKAPELAAYSRGSPKENKAILF